MNGTITRQAAYDTLTEYYHHKMDVQHAALREALKRVPDAELDQDLHSACAEYLQSTCNQLATDCISRREVFDLIRQYGDLADTTSLWERIEELPTVKPNVIRCKDCKHHRYDNDGIPYCLRLDYGYGWGDDDFCSRVKKKKKKRECGNEGRWE
jgi:hypothetical protein